MLTRDWHWFTMQTATCARDSDARTWRRQSLCIDAHQLYEWSDTCGFSSRFEVKPPARSGKCAAWWTPISGPVSSEQTVPSACPRPRKQPNPISMTECSCRAHPFLQFLAATDRARHPSGSSDRRTAVTGRPGGFATPEERWCRNVSMGFARDEGCRYLGANSQLARIAGGPL